MLNPQCTRRKSTRRKEIPTARSQGYTLKGLQGRTENRRTYWADGYQDTPDSIVLFSVQLSLTPFSHTSIHYQLWLTLASNSSRKMNLSPLWLHLPCTTCSLHSSTSLHLLKHAEHTPTSGPLHRLFSPPRVRSLRYFHSHPIPDFIPPAQLPPSLSTPHLPYLALFFSKALFFTQHIYLLTTQLPHWSDGSLWASICLIHSLQYPQSLEQSPEHSG